MKNQQDGAQFPSADVLGTNLLTRDGSFSREELFFSGRRPELSQFGRISFVAGLSGTETRVTRDVIVPKGVFEVK